jgi:hypothetical protein
MRGVVLPGNRQVDLGEFPLPSHGPGHLREMEQLLEFLVRKRLRPETTGKLVITPS